MSGVITDYTLVSLNQITKIRGTDNQQTTTGLLYRAPEAGIVNVSGSASPDALTRSAGGGVGRSMLQGIGMGGFELFNSSGGTITVAIGVRIPNYLWGFGQWVNAATTPFTDDTVDAQDTGTADDAVLQTTTNNDGFVIHSAVPFNAFGIDVDTAGDAATNALRYTNTAGTGWTNIGTTLAAESLAVTGERIWLWHTPPDWGKITGTGLSGIPPNRYAVNFRSTTAPAAAAATAGSLEVYRFYFINEALTNNTLYTWWPGGTEAQMTPGDALVAFFGTADNLNAVTALVRPRV